MNPPLPSPLERYFAKTEPVTQVHLCASGCEAFTLRELRALCPELEGYLWNSSLGYPETRGSLALRTAISHQYETLPPENILVHNGAAEALFTTLHAVLQPQDHVIVHAPCYPSLLEVPKAIGCDITLWQADETRGWAVSVEQLNALRQPNTKAVVFNFPHNPTGFVLHHQQFYDLITFARRHGLYLISDEVYRGLEHHQAYQLPAIADRYEKGISIASLSKTMALPGLRVGWVALQDKPLLEKIYALKDYTTIAHSQLSEVIATEALKQFPVLQKRNLALLEHNKIILSRFLDTHFQWFTAELPYAGASIFLRLIGIESSRQLCDTLLQEAGILLLPSDTYGYKDHHLRLGFGSRDFEHSLLKLSQALSHYSQIHQRRTIKTSAAVSLSASSSLSLAAAHTST